MSVLICIIFVFVGLHSDYVGNGGAAAAQNGAATKGNGNGVCIELI